jgi:hypothetical protein
MAVEMDREICSKMFRHPNIVWRRKTHFFRKVIRRGLRQIDDFRKIRKVSFEPRWNEFTQFSQELSANGYVFVENFLAEADYEILKLNWPKTRFFTPVVPNEDHKTSDKGLYCQRGAPGFDTKRNPIIWSLYEMFRSKDFCQDVSHLCGDQVSRTPYHLLCQNSFWGSGLAPHRDSHDEETHSKINFIFFVESNGSGWEAGGTGIMRSNSFDEPIFVPQNLNNSCLFYFSESDLFHGFPTMKFGKYRRNVIAHFCAS